MAVVAKPVVRERRDIEDLVIWALVDNGLGAEFVERAGRMDWRDLGTRVQTSGGGWALSGPRVQHDDAFKIAGRILWLPPEAVELVVRHGRTNCRPDWCEEGVGHEETKTNKRGQTEWIYAVPGNPKSRKLGPRTVWVGETEAAVEWYRARYSLWWVALRDMVGLINEVLERYEATGPRAPETPWDGVRVFGPDGQVVTGLHGEDASMRLAKLRERGLIEIEHARQGGNLRGSGNAE
jgi:hypothetical protein